MKTSIPLAVVDKAISQLRKRITTSNDELEINLTDHFTLHVNVETCENEYQEIEISDVYLLNSEYNVVEDNFLIDYITRKLDITAKRINSESYQDYRDYSFSE